MEGIALHILSPEGRLVETQVSRVSLPGAAGAFVVLKDHAPLVTALTEGEIAYTDASGDQTLRIRGGFAEVLRNEVRVCVEG